MKILRASDALTAKSQSKLRRINKKLDILIKETRVIQKNIAFAEMEGDEEFIEYFSAQLDSAYVKALKLEDEIKSDPVMRYSIMTTLSNVGVN